MIEKKDEINVLVSVIIPVYNTEKYLPRCLDSVIRQTLENIEIICINDGSTDRCPQILEDYAGRDNRVKVIDKQNGGACAARKTGEMKAQGKYIGYVDSDDWIESDMYEKLYKYACESNAEIVTSGYFFEGNYTTVHLDTLEEGLYRNEKMNLLRENTIYSFEHKETGIRASLCCKLFSKELVLRVQDLIPDNLLISEDKMCLLTRILECKSVLVLKEAYYHYVMNADSMVHTANSNYLIAVNEVYQFLLKLYSHRNFTESMRMQSELYIVELLLKGINSLIGFHVHNLLWIDPYWLNKIPKGSRIVLYGAGEAGRKYRQQLLSFDDFCYAGCVDFEYSHIDDKILEVQSPDTLKEIQYDFIVITIKNCDKALQVRTQLEKLGVVAKKILWFEQKELFWRYAEKEGLLKNKKG